MHILTRTSDRHFFSNLYYVEPNNLNIFYQQFYKFYVGRPRRPLAPLPPRQTRLPPRRWRPGIAGTRTPDHSC